MPVRSAALVYFSPTGATRKIVKEIAKGLGAERLRELDITKPEARKELDGVSEDIAVIGAPVHYETVPELAEKALRKMKGAGKPAVLVAVYGNIGCGVALPCLRDIAEAAGFRPVAAAAFVGEHSFSTAEVPVAQGRPDSSDLVEAFAFGAAAAKRVGEGIPAGAKLEVSGKLKLTARLLPKGSAKRLSRAPSLDGLICKLCGACARACPAGAIKSGSLSIDPKLCLRCFACVRRCPKNARKIVYKYKFLVKTVLKMMGGRRKEPKVFLI